MTTLPTAQSQIDSMDQAIESAVGSLYASATALFADNTAKVAQVATLQAQVAAANTQHASDAAAIAKLQATPSAPATGAVHDAKGAAVTVTIPVGTHLIGDSYINAKFGAAQHYAVELSSNVVATNINGQSDAGGIRAGNTGSKTPANAITVNGATTIGCGQEGFSTYASNSTFNSIVSHDNNAAGVFDSYNESGAGKSWATTSSTFNNLDYRGPGNLYWTDGGCKNNVVNGGTFVCTAQAGRNVGKQCSPIRIELTNGQTLNGVTATSAPNENSALIISDSSDVTDNGGIYQGQVGVTDNGRKSYTNPNTGEAIDTSLKNIVFNGTTFSSAYWPDTMSPPPTFNGVKLTAKAGQPVAYITHSGKASTPILLADFQKQYDARASMAAQ